MAWQVGFTESNIRALCDVGRTTKKHTVGYIGQKGIGFKSVFKITDAPQIHSRGFHVAFDLLQHSALGYVLPTWVQDSQDVAMVSKMGSHQPATKVVLPFKKVCSYLSHPTCTSLISLMLNTGEKHACALLLHIRLCSTQ